MKKGCCLSEQSMESSDKQNKIQNIDSKKNGGSSENGDGNENLRRPETVEKDQSPELNQPSNQQDIPHVQNQGNVEYTSHPHSSSAPEYPSQEGPSPASSNFIPAHQGQAQNPCSFRSRTPFASAIHINLFDNIPPSEEVRPHLKSWQDPRFYQFSIACGPPQSNILPYYNQGFPIPRFPTPRSSSRNQKVPFTNQGLLPHTSQFNLPLGASCLANFSSNPQPYCTYTIFNEGSPPESLFSHRM